MVETSLLKSGLIKAHPDVPVIFVEDSYVPRTEFNTKNHEDIKSRNQEQKALFKRLKKAGEKNIYYACNP